jgi:dipeptidyl aminopeptidase/acylaminoacyl peptidase
MITPRPDTRPPRRPLDISDVLRLQSFHDSHGRSAAFSADGRKLAFCSQRPLSTATAHRDWPMTGIARGELHIVDITSGHIKQVASPDDLFSPSWSPCGNYLAFGEASEQAVRLTLVDLRTGARSWPLPGQLQLVGMPTFAWLGPGRLVCALVSGARAPDTLDLERRGANRAARFWQSLETPGQCTASALQSLGDEPAHSNPDRTEFVIYDTALQRCTPLDPAAQEPRAHDFRRRFESFDREVAQCDGAVPDGALLAVHAPSKQAAFLVEDEQGSRITLLNTESHAQTVLFHVNTHLQEVRAGQVRDIDYVDAKGKPARVRMLLPPDHVEGVPCPAVFWVYPGAVPGPSARHLLKPHEAGPFNLQLLAARGYIVVEPALPIDPMPGSPDLAQALAGHIKTAIEHCLKSGLVDARRMHVFGHSFGGWAVMSLLTTTGFFRSGISMAGMSNLVSLHGSFDPRFRYDESLPQGNRSPMLVEAIFGLKTPPWKDLDAYVRHSPLFAVENISVPLMIVQGDQDYIPISQGEEMFTALQRLGKKASFVRYWGEGHMLSGKANIEDRWLRIFDWLEEHSR